jgi:large-conductance mechanosensitive channel
MVKITKKIILLTFLSLAPLIVLAQANLFISPANGAYKIGEAFSILINANTGGQAINAATAQINFDNTRLEITEIGYSRSIFTLWTEEPVFSNVAGTVRFSGGLPNPGFTGASGAILRINFKPKASGQAAVVFSSGAVLANDGKGTNITDSLKGALFNIVAATPSAPISTSTPEVIKAEKPISAPTITECPGTLQAGDVLTIKGLGYPEGKILIFVQKGTNDPEIAERFCGTDGRFTYNFKNPVEPGYYRIWVKNVTSEGVTSDSSEAKNIEVVQPLFFRIGAISFNYATIIVTLLGLLTLALLIIVAIFLKTRHWRRKRRKEIGEAEDALHRAFDLLKEDIRENLKNLEKARSKRGLTNEEEKIANQLGKNLDDAERFLKKEIEDIERELK